MGLDAGNDQNATLQILHLNLRLPDDNDYGSGPSAFRIMARIPAEALTENAETP